MRAYLDYFATYVERDVRQLLRVKDLSKFETFIKLLAGRIGQVANLHALGGDVGVSSTTLAKWISVLEASFVIFRLPSYHRNLGKRLVKSPKFFFYEPGLAAALLQIETPEQAGRDPLMGNLFENVVVVELLKGQLNRGLNGTWSYFRDNSGNEVDLIWERQRIPQPIEIKAGRTWTPEWTKRLEWFSALAGEERPSWVVHPGDVRRSGATDPAHCARDILDDL